MRQLGLFTFLIYLVDCFTQRTFFIAGVIERSVLFVISQEVFYFVFAVCNLFDQIASHTVPIEVAISVTLAEQTEIFRIEFDIIEDVLLDIIG